MAAGDGLISMKPTSITHSGTSASINSDGGVDFTAVTSLSLNGVFTSDYDNYLIVINADAATATYVRLRLRASGSDATGSNYTNQALTADGGTVAGSRATADNWPYSYLSTNNGGYNIHAYGPALAQPTAFRSVSVDSLSSAYLEDRAATHSLSTSYDGFTLYQVTHAMTGTVHVFGYEE